LGYAGVLVARGGCGVVVGGPVGGELSTEGGERVLGDVFSEKLPGASSPSRPGGDADGGWR